MSFLIITFYPVTIYASVIFRKQMKKRTKELPLCTFINIGEQAKIYLLTVHINTCGQRIKDFLHCYIWNRQVWNVVEAHIISSTEMTKVWCAVKRALTDSEEWLCYVYNREYMFCQYYFQHSTNSKNVCGLCVNNLNRNKKKLSDSQHSWTKVKLTT